MYDYVSCVYTLNMCGADTVREDVVHTCDVHHVKLHVCTVTVCGTKH